MYFTTTRRKTRKDRIHIQFFAQVLKKTYHKELFTSIQFKDSVKLQISVAELFTATLKI